MTRQRTSTADIVAVSVRLYVAKGAPNSLKAHDNLREALEQFELADDLVEIVDVFEAPERALDDGVLVTPMLVRLQPEPVRRLIGTLDDIESLRRVFFHE